MKTKPILISIAAMLLLVAVFFFVRGRNSAKPGKDEINQFLNGFNNRVKEGNTDSLMAYFETGKSPKVLKRLVNLLEGKKGVNGKEKPVFSLSLDVDASDIKIANADFITATIPVKFTHDSVDNKQSTLILKIHKIGPHQFKIMRFDARQLLVDYVAYENYVQNKFLDEQIVFSPITLAGFKTAEQLKTKYDSVIWFAHVNEKTFFYVIKGKWDARKDINREKDSVIEPYKMGLINPELREIIPVDYDLIHNIGATFPGLVEVEKENKRGFYDLQGKIIVPVNYDQIFPIDDDHNLAVLKNGPDYFYLKKDMTISEKVDIKIADFFPKITDLANQYNIYKKALSVVTEYNSRDDNGAVYISPSYLSDLNIVYKIIDFKNPLRKGRYDLVHENYEVRYSGAGRETPNWLLASFYSIRDYFLGGRSEFYDKKNLLVIDKKNDKVFIQDIGTDYSPSGEGSLAGNVCDINNIKAINDSLYEVKAGAVLWIDLYDTTKSIVGGTYYHYLVVKGDKLVELPNNRNFGFTKYVKMDDSYLSGCYNMVTSNGNNQKKTNIDRITVEMLRYMKNEIYADYRYQFKDKRWQAVFLEMASYDDRGENNKPNNVSVDDSLTVIDKYNINWINQKLKGVKTTPNTLASK